VKIFHIDSSFGSSQSVLRPVALAAQRTQSTSALLASAPRFFPMAYGELPNFSVHAKGAPWNEVNFYEILGLEHDPSDLPDDVEEAAARIVEAGARKLVSIPTISANMDYYTKQTPQGWTHLSGAAERKFNELMQAYEAATWFLYVIFF